MIRIVIADDHHLIRRGFSQYLQRTHDMEMVGEAETGEYLLQLCRQLSFDILLLDIGLPDRNGLEVLKDLKNLRPDVKTLVISMHPEERYAKRALESGAMGYISKGSDPDELERAIKKVARGERYIPPGLADVLASEIGAPHGTLPHERLSDREYQILIGLGSGQSVKHIASAFNISNSTVYTYKDRIEKKLHLKSNADLFQYVLNHNLIEK